MELNAGKAAVDAAAAVLFDFHETLVDLDPPALDELARWLGIDRAACRAGLDAVERRLTARRVAGEWPPPLHQRWRAVYGLLVECLGLDADGTELAEHMSRRYAATSSYVVYPDAITTLRRLSETGLRLGVVSNTDLDLWPLLDALGLSRYLDVAVATLCHGVEKPDPRAFALALDELGVPASQCWFVGDNLTDDAVASGAIGMRAVLLDRTGRYDGAAGGRFPVLQSLAELPALVGL